MRSFSENPVKPEDATIPADGIIREMKTMEDWNVILNSPVPVVFQCSASWCRPCQVLRPVIEKLISNFNGKVVFYYIDIEKHQQVAEMLQVAHVPMVYLVKEGQLVESFSGV